MVIGFVAKLSLVKSLIQTWTIINDRDMTDCKDIISSGKV